MLSLTSSPDASVLLEERGRAERRLNTVRALLLILLAVTALAYAPVLAPRLNRVNAMVLVPMLAWTGAQLAIMRRRRIPPAWLGLANPLADTAAITLTMAGYGIEAGPALALKSPMVLAYFAVLASRPMVSSARRAAWVAAVVVAAYAALDAGFLLTHDILIGDPVAASTSGRVAWLDEAAKLVLLAAAGAVATYATWWHEQLARRYAAAAGAYAALQERLSSARLDALKQQLRPHFLFNALNAISALVTTDPDSAQRMIAGLGDLLRTSLDSGGAEEVSLRRELDVLSHYLAIQRVRFHDRLTIVTAVQDGLDDALVPALILQPLVENAITYGVGQFAAPVRVEVRAHRGADGDLRLEVSDDGPGLAGRAPGEIVERIGIGNARARLLSLYGARHTFTIESPPGGGFHVRIGIPFRTVPAPRPPVHPTVA